MKRFNHLLALCVLIAFCVNPIPASAVSSNPTPDCSAGTTCTITFAFTGDYYAWTAPSGVTSLTVDLYGAQGGSGGSTGGQGGRVQGTLSVTAGSTIYIYVGGQSGFNGGGAAGTGGGSSTLQTFPGGGATDIRVGGLNYSNRVAVAGGGGGAGRNSCLGQTGGGGGYPGGLGGVGASNLAGSAGTLTSGGSVSGGGGGADCSSSSRGGGGGGQTGGGGAGGYGTSTGGTGGTCGTVNNRVDSSVSGGGGGCLGTGGAGGNHTNNGGGGGGGGYYGGGSGGANWGSGGGGGSSFLGTMTNTSFVNATRTGNGVATVTYLNSPIPTTFSTSQASPTNIGTGSTISYSLVLSQSVSDLTVGDFQYGGTATCNTPGLSGSGTTYTVTVTNCTEGTLILQLKANSITGTSAGPPSVSSANTVVIDRTAPTITSVIPPANKTYIPGETATFTMNFSESITMTGTPILTLLVGSETRSVQMSTLADARTARFVFTVPASFTLFDIDGIEVVTTLNQNSAVIRDLATNNISDLTFPSVNTSSIFVAQLPAAPTIDSITATSGTLTVFFTPGAARGSTISNYQFSLNNGAWTTRASGTTASPIVIGSLVNGTGYAVRLRPLSNAGTGAISTAVTETPTAVIITGDSTLTLTYGDSASTSAYSATGGTNSYDWTLGSTLTGITLSGTTVTAGPTTPAGTYTQSVRATDGNNQVGTRSLTITVNKASTSITIALPNSATSAALGGAVTITATVPRAGAVNFQLGGATLTGCGAAAAVSTTATCSWTPLALGSVALTAIFTPTDTANFETSTTTTLTITVVNGVSTVSLSLTGGVTQVPKGKAINIIAAIDQAGRITFLIDGKRIPGCFNLVASVIGNRSCSWKPAVQKRVNITARLVPTNNVFNPSVSSLVVQVVRRTGARSVGGGGIPSI